MLKQQTPERVAVVTGASSGVGRAVVRALARDGVRLGLIARNHDGLSAAAEEVTQLGSHALVLPLDVSQAGQMMEAARQVVDTWGRLDIWINNAMVSVFAQVEDITPDEYRRVTEVNYLGYVYGTLAALHHMRMKNRGTIVQVGSALAYRSIPLQSAYCASKAAIRGFTDSLRSELFHMGSRIKLCMVQLPAVNTPQFEVVRNRLPSHPKPVPPIYQPEVIADAVAYVIKHPRREMWIGWSAVRAIVGQRLVPGFLDRYLATRAWRSQQTTRLPLGHPLKHQRDNIEVPLPGDRGAHGPFDASARRMSLQSWANTHRLSLGVAGLCVAMLGALAWRQRAK